MIQFSHDGERVFRRFEEPGAREVQMNALEAELLLVQLRNSDWSLARRMADDLAACISATQQQQTEEAA